MNPPQISRRPASEADRPFLYILYADVRAAELAQTSWNDEQKRAFLDMQFNAQVAGYGEMFPDGAHEIIEVAEESVGRVYWSLRSEDLHLVDITIAPEWRNKGIGGLVLKAILEQADEHKKPSSLYVEVFNPSRNLFERLGFSITEQDGFQLLMHRQPQ